MGLRVRGVRGRVRGVREDEIEGERGEEEWD